MRAVLALHMSVPQSIVAHFHESGGELGFLIMTPLPNTKAPEHCATQPSVSFDGMSRRAITANRN